MDTNDKDMKYLADRAREYREKLTKDCYRPRYHMVIPEGVSVPCDANAGIFYNGRHHMYYIFQDEEGKHCFGHYASCDLLHWTCLPTGPRPSEESGIHGMFSGNAFIDADGKVRIMYHDVGKGNTMIVAEDDELTEWKAMPDSPMTSVSEDCDKWRSWDPCGWVEDGKYYAIYGWFQPALFTSDDGIHFTYVGPFMDRAQCPFGDYEDVSCPDFFKMNGKDVLMHISHARGWQYEIGHFDGTIFRPENWGRFNFAGGQFFAGESYYDDKGRRVLMGWVLDAMLSESVRKELGWSGTMSLPRIVTMSDDGTELYSEIPEEMKTLRYNAQEIKTSVNVRIQSEAELVADVFDCGNAGIRFRFNGQEYVDCIYDKTAQTLKIDYAHSSVREDVFHPLRPLDIVNAKGADDFRNAGAGIRNQNWDGVTEEMLESGVATYTECPLRLAEGEKLKMNAFLDGSIFELFANERAALTVRIYPADMRGCTVSLIGDGYRAESATAYDIAPTNMY